MDSNMKNISFAKNFERIEELYIQGNFLFYDQDNIFEMSQLKLKTLDISSNLVEDSIVELCNLNLEFLESLGLENCAIDE